ncbi:MAG: DUF192 domain-containing protein [Acidobacteriota bacterium]|nr:DUF192 domain-containing protein [Acidobacteriota bacterium]
MRKASKAGLLAATAVALTVGLTVGRPAGRTADVRAQAGSTADVGAPAGSPPMGSATLSVAPAAAAGSPGRSRVACVLEASTTAQQNYGLMYRSTVAPYAGMAFVFDRPSDAQFYMRHTLIPLAIAWFDAQGRFEAETVMAPCPDQVQLCPTYGPGRLYSLALEVPAGGLGPLGVGPGAVAHMGGPCR